MIVRTTPIGSALIGARGVTLTRGGKDVVADVSLDISPQDFLTIVGPNGSGKSSLLRCLIGLIKPSKGRVDRRDIRIGYVPQGLHADPVMPLLVVDFLSLRHHRSKKDIDSMAAQTGITGILSRSLHTLSGGELQRVYLARALMHDPDVLMLDEPVAHLDIGGQLAFYRMLEQLYRRGTMAIVIVSHDVHLVLACSKRVICLYHHICCAGTPQVVTKDPAFQRLFGEDMARMMTVYHHSHDHVHEGQKPFNS